ncbi:hypothetical protein J6590_045770 [Homalodisca vitripennis]|nr:hypothetical protein J6590_045770 [Homalodisca vitripennis]
MRLRSSRGLVGSVINKKVSCGLFSPSIYRWFVLTIDIPPVVCNIGVVTSSQIRTRAINFTCRLVGRSSGPAANFAYGLKKFEDDARMLNKMDRKSSIRHCLIDINKSESLASEKARRIAQATAPRVYRRKCHQRRFSSNLRHGAALLCPGITIELLGPVWRNPNEISMEERVEAAVAPDDGYVLVRLLHGGKSRGCGSSRRRLSAGTPPRACVLTNCMSVPDEVSMEEGVKAVVGPDDGYLLVRLLVLEFNIDQFMEEGVEAAVGPDDGYLLVRIHVPELNVHKCLQFPKDQLVWDVKQQCLAALPKVSTRLHTSSFCCVLLGKLL